MYSANKNIKEDEIELYTEYYGLNWESYDIV